MDGKKKFGLVLSDKSEKLRPKVISIFDNSSDEETVAQKKRPKISQVKPVSSKSGKSETVDPSIYEYDSIYDDMKAKQIEEKFPKEKKQSRYIDTLLKAAEKRKKQYERRVEKKIQVEREKEGDKFKDKEEFVTSSYKKKMQEMEEEEERERRESLMNDMMDVTKQKDLSGFYRHFLNQAIGEEKIPTFGERHTVKEEPFSDTENDHMQNKPNKGNIEKVPKENDPVFRDSDSLSSDRSEDSEDQSEKEKHYEKQKNKLYSDQSEDSEEQSARKEYRKKHKNKLSSDKSVDSEEQSAMKKYKKHQSKLSSNKSEDSKEQNQRKKYKKPKNKQRHDSCSDSDSENNHKKSDRHESFKKNFFKNSRISKNSSSDVSLVEEHDKETKTSEHNDSEPTKEIEESNLNNKKSKPKNIFEKRTVGSIFDEAQARYFIRLAARNA